MSKPDLSPINQICEDAVEWLVPICVLALPCWVGVSLVAQIGWRWIVGVPLAAIPIWFVAYALWRAWGVVHEAAKGE